MKKVLIVEDDASLLKALESGLSGNDFEVLTASNGEEGLRSAEEQRPNLILLDLIMPKMDGITMLKKLRSTDWGKDMSVIILTNNEQELTAAVDNKVFDYLIKTNWKIEDVLKKVKVELKYTK
jgi:DNA-binding response OmpR family regulator